MKLLPTQIRPIPFIAYSTARSAQFTVQFLLLETLYRALLTQRKPHPGSPSLFLQVHQDLLRFLQQDAEKIADGTYPTSVLKPESPVSHLSRLPQIFADAWSITRRKNKGRTTEFNADAEELLSQLPRYYRRNFHFQTDGYLSEKSAELYEHQVEMLFHGGADAMRRLIVASLRKRFGSSDGRGLRFLEIGAGTGRSTRFVHLAFPKAKIVATDLSDPYLQVARRKLEKFQKIDFIQAPGEELPFQDHYFDAVYSVFLFHELPLEARKAVLKESWRVLNPGGFLGLVDSLQKDDFPDYLPLLENFHHEFHEPFYRNYIENPMQELVSQMRFEEIEHDRGFLSKWVSARKPTT